EGAERRDSLRIRGPAVALELVDGGIVRGGGGGERRGGRVMGGALPFELPAPAGRRGRVPLDGLVVVRAGAVELLLIAGCCRAAEEPASPGRLLGGEMLPLRCVQRLAEPGR